LGIGLAVGALLGRALRDLADHPRGVRHAVGTVERRGVHRGSSHRALVEAKPLDVRPIACAVPRIHEPGRRARGRGRGWGGGGGCCCRNRLPIVHRRRLIALLVACNGVCILRGRYRLGRAAGQGRAGSVPSYGSSSADGPRVRNNLRTSSSSISWRRCLISSALLAGITESAGSLSLSHSSSLRTSSPLSKRVAILSPTAAQTQRSESGSYIWPCGVRAAAASFAGLPDRRGRLTARSPVRRGAETHGRRSAAAERHGAGGLKRLDEGRHRQHGGGNSHGRGAGHRY